MPHVAYFYLRHPSQATGNMGGDPERLRDTFRMNYRVYRAALDERERSVDACKAIMRHAIFMRRTYLEHYLWRLGWSDALSILRECRFTEATGDGLVDFTNRHVVATVCALMLMKPLLGVAVWLRRVMK